MTEHSRPASPNHRSVGPVRIYFSFFLNRNDYGPSLFDRAAAPAAHTYASHGAVGWSAEAANNYIIATRKRGKNRTENILTSIVRRSRCIDSSRRRVPNAVCAHTHTHTRTYTRHTHARAHATDTSTRTRTYARAVAATWEGDDDEEPQAPPPPSSSFTVQCSTRYGRG